jgi:hypothetical protein
MTWNRLIEAQRIFNESGEVKDHQAPEPKPKKQELKSWCIWCHGMTFDDMRGHCCACGGPRPEDKKNKIEDTIPPFNTDPCVGGVSGSVSAFSCYATGTLFSPGAILTELKMDEAEYKRFCEGASKSFVVRR